MIDVDRPGWHARAQCHGQTEVMFPEREDAVALEAAREVCAGCPVQARCLDAALSVSTTLDYGLWAGTTRRQRMAIRRERQPEAAPMSQAERDVVILDLLDDLDEPMSVDDQRALAELAGCAPSTISTDLRRLRRERTALAHQPDLDVLDHLETAA